MQPTRCAQRQQQRPPTRAAFLLFKSESNRKGPVRRFGLIECSSTVASFSMRSNCFFLSITHLRIRLPNLFVIPAEEVQLIFRDCKKPFLKAQGPRNQIEEACVGNHTPMRLARCTAIEQIPTLAPRRLEFWMINSSRIHPLTRPSTIRTFHF